MSQVNESTITYCSCHESLRFWLGLRINDRLEENRLDKLNKISRAKLDSQHSLVV